MKAFAVVMMPFVTLAAEWTFPNGGDPQLVVPHCEELAFPEGFKATLRFSVDLDEIGESGYANLFCKGKNFESGYCVMVKNSGALLIDLKGIYPSYYHPETRLVSNREYLLEIYVAKGVVRVFVDGKEDGSYLYAKSFDFSTQDPLRIGSMGVYTFAGSIRSFRLESLTAVAVPSGGPAEISAEPPHRQARAEILWSKPICIESDRYVGWPTVTRLQNGDLLAVFSGDRDRHVCPWGKVQLVRSTDEGETWSAPQTIHDFPIDDRDAGIVQMPDGEIVVTWFTSVFYRNSFHPEGEPYASDDPVYRWECYDKTLSPETVEESLGYFRMVSRDNGKTWSKPMRMSAVGNAPHGPRLLSDGSLLQLGVGSTVRMIGGESRTCSCLNVCRSTDRGATWQVLCADVPWTDDEGLHSLLLDEPDVIEAADGTFVGMVRFNEDEQHWGDHYLRQTVSRDGGKTWTPTVRSDVIGYPAHLLKLSDGKLVCSYSRRKANPGYGEFAVVSDDNGKTWDVANEIVLRRHGDGDLGYPSSCQLPDGSIVTVYYQPQALGEKPCLMATKWRVLSPGESDFDSSALTNGLFAFYPFTDGAQTNFVFGGNDATMVNFNARARSQHFDPALEGLGYRGYGDLDYANLGKTGFGESGIVNDPPTDPWRTVSLWMYHDPNGRPGGHVPYNPSLVSQLYAFDLIYLDNPEDAGARGFWLFQGWSGHRFARPEKDPAGRWTHVVAMFDRHAEGHNKDLSELWIDGVKQQPVDMAVSFKSRSSEKPVTVGGCAHSGYVTTFHPEYCVKNDNVGTTTRTFGGVIDEVRFYDRRLSGEEIRYLATHPVHDEHQAPSVAAFPEKTRTQPGGTNVVDATANGDGIAYDSRLTYEWLVLSGETDKLTFGDRFARWTTVTAQAAGMYVVQLKVCDGERTTYSDPITLDCGPRHGFTVLIH